MEAVSRYQDRTYKYDDVCVFRKTKEAFGALSNMASGFPIKLNGVSILTSEALYQACRFPNRPDVQRRIINERSPMTAKMVGKPFRVDTRLDWDSIRVDIMYWCLRVKLAQNFVAFGRILESTYNKQIVEDSSKDSFWGAIKDKSNEGCLTGINALGRLLMKLRQEYNSEKRFDLLLVEPLIIPDFTLFGRQIETVDERQTFINGLQARWSSPTSPVSEKCPDVQTERLRLEDAIITVSQLVLSEPKVKVAKPKKPRARKAVSSKSKTQVETEAAAKPRAKRQSKKKVVVQPELPLM